MPALTNPRHERFCLLFVQTGNQKTAYEAAGYSYRKASAHRMVTSPKIERRVAELRALKQADDDRIRESAVGKATLDETWIITRLMYLTERSLRGAPLLDNKGVQTGKFSGKPDGATAVKCLALAAQIKGMLVQRHEIGNPGDFAAMTDEQLEAKLIEQGRKLGMAPDVLQTAFRGGVYEVEDQQ